MLVYPIGGVLASEAASVTLDPDGDALIGGSIGDRSTGPGTAYLARLTPRGALDPSLGESGVVTFASTSALTQLRVKSDGEIVVLAGELLAFASDGSPLRGFGVAGSAVLPVRFTPTRVALAAGGQIMLAGTIPASGRGDAVALVRLLANGRPDRRFATDGMLVLPTPTDEHGAPTNVPTPGGLAIEPDGSIVLSVRGERSLAESPGGPDISVLMHVTNTGQLDPRFGVGGQALIDGPGEVVGDVDPVVQRDGNILVPVIRFGSIGADSGPLVVSFSPDGDELTTPELAPESESVSGFAPLTDGSTLILEPEPFGLRLLLTQQVSDASGSPKPGPLGYRTAVSLPARATDDRSLFAAQPDGKLLLVGSAPDADGVPGLFVERLLGLSGVPELSISAMHRRENARGLSLTLKCAASEECVGRAHVYAPATAQRPRVSARATSFTIAAGRTRAIVLALPSRSGATHRRRLLLSVALDGASTITRTLAPAPVRRQ